MTEIRFIQPDEEHDYYRAIVWGFGGDGDADETRLARFSKLNPVENSLAAFDRGHMVATFGSYDLELTMPGGATVPMAGTTNVTVHPTHRRRGILTEMMRRHIDQAIDKGQPLAGLWASEERIYGRFGYGPAVWAEEISIADHSAEVSAPDPAISLYPVTVEEAEPVLPALYEAYRPGVAGALVRTDGWWANHWFPDPEDRRGGAGVRRHVVAERSGEPVGYLAFRLKELEPWGEGQTRIVELIALDGGVRRALWHFATNIDLYRNVRWWNAPVDDPGIIELDRFRQAERKIMDSLWLRPLDVAALCEARSYDVDGRLVFGIADRFGPTEGTYALDVVDGVGRCGPSTDRADVELSVEEFGRLILGGTSAVALHRAGLVVGAAVDVATLHDLFSTRDRPHCPEDF